MCIEIPKDKPTRVTINGGAWTPPLVFQWLAESSQAGEAEMLRTFNCGIGMVLVVGASEAQSVCAMLQAEGEAPVIMGEVEASVKGDRVMGGEQVSVVGTGAWGW